MHLERSFVIPINMSSQYDKALPNCGLPIPSELTLSYDGSGISSLLEKIR